jgi:glycosyltransferase involved in cell wall biosynthesis
MPEKKSVLYVGQAFYNHWYLSRELRKLGWKADQLDYETTLNDTFYHGRDFSFAEPRFSSDESKLEFYFNALMNYSIFHFANAHGLLFLQNYDYILGDKAYLAKKRSGLFYKPTHSAFQFLFDKILKWDLVKINKLRRILGIKRSHKLLTKYAHHLPERWDVLLIKKVGKKTAYTNNGCLDGVLQSTFDKWSTPDNNPICSTICPWKNNPAVCSDERNRKWGEFRNSVSDYVCLTVGNRADFNLSDKVHERPEVYCLDNNFWNPAMLIPSNYILPFPKSTFKIYHSVGNYDLRSQSGNKTIKSTHIYIDVVNKLKKNGYDVELIFFKDVPNKIIRYYQAQADVIVDMLSFGAFGANIREGMMLGKPCVCYLRPEWMEQLRAELPEYADEMPVISATPQTVEEILIDLISNPDKRKQIGVKSREFAVKWHSSDIAAKKFDEIYTRLLNEPAKKS